MVDPRAALGQALADRAALDDRRISDSPALGRAARPWPSAPCRRPFLRPWRPKRLADLAVVAVDGQRLERRASSPRSRSPRSPRRWRSPACSPSSRSQPEMNGWIAAIIRTWPIGGDGRARPSRSRRPRSAPGAAPGRRSRGRARRCRRRSPRPAPAGSRGACSARGTVSLTICIEPPPTSFLNFTRARSGSTPVVSQSIMRADGAGRGEHAGLGVAEAVCAPSAGTSCQVSVVAAQIGLSQVARRAGRPAFARRRACASRAACGSALRA